MIIRFPDDTPITAITDAWWSWLLSNGFKKPCKLRITNYPHMIVEVVTTEYTALYIYFLLNFSPEVAEFAVIAGELV